MTVNSWAATVRCQCFTGLRDGGRGLSLCSVCQDSVCLIHQFMLRSLCSVHFKAGAMVEGRRHIASCSAAAAWNAAPAACAACTSAPHLHAVCFIIAQASDERLKIKWPLLCTLRTVYWVGESPVTAMHPAWS